MCGVDRVLFSGAGMSLEAAWKQLGSSWGARVAPKWSNPEANQKFENVACPTVVHFLRSSTQVVGPGYF
jgi:hypothetical protein